MRVLVVHNRYRLAGGEDAVVRDEAALLARHGIEVETYERSNTELDGGFSLATLADTLWSHRTVADIERIRRRFAPDVIHVHNTFPLVSPSVYACAAGAGPAVVQTLHNFRLFCVQAMLLRDGKVCEDCLGNSPWRGVLHRCYRDSHAQSAVAAGMLTLHRALGTYRKRIHRYVALNQFCRRKFIEAGLPAARVVVKPNFVDLPAPADQAQRQGGLYVGRLSSEKGMAVLAAAMAPVAPCSITVVGSGPDEATLRGVPGLRLAGWADMAAIHARMRGASWLVMPSIWYENFPRVLVEAYACGLPVIASRLGALAELVEDGVTGLLFEAGNASAMRAALAWAHENPVDMARMGRAARRAYEQRYTPDINLRELLDIYGQAISESAAPRSQREQPAAP